MKTNRDKDIYELISAVMYHEISVCPDDDGWFNVEELLDHFAELKAAMNNIVIDRSCLEKIVESDKDNRFIFNDDKTLLRINTDHIAPKDVEEQLKTANRLNIKQSVFRKNHLPFKKDSERIIRISCSNGDAWSFGYETNKILFLDKKRFIMLVEYNDNPALVVSAYMSKASGKYRMKFVDMPMVINYIYPVEADILDYEGNSYRVSIVTDE